MVSGGWGGYRCWAALTTVNDTLIIVGEVIGWDAQSAWASAAATWPAAVADDLEVARVDELLQRGSAGMFSPRSEP
jgi:hypothetical protein